MTLHSWLPTEASLSLDVLLRNGREAHDAAARIYGVVPAKICAMDDKKNQRHMQQHVQIWFPWLQPEKDGKLFKVWARCTTCDGGNKTSSGFKMSPQVGDEVLVAFEHGDPHVPYVLGQLWNKGQTIPPPTTPADPSDCKCQNGGPTLKTPDLTPQSLAGNAGKNKIMYMKSRSGNLIAMDDDKGTVRICDKTGQSAVQLEKDQILILQRTGDIRVFAQNKITFNCETYQVHASSLIKYHANNNINVAAKGNVNTYVGGDKGGLTDVTAGKDFVMTSKKTASIRASGNVSMMAMGKMSFASKSDDMKVESGASLMMTGVGGINMKSSQKGNMEGKSMVSVNSPATVNFKAGSDFEAKGAVIMLN